MGFTGLSGCPKSTKHWYCQMLLTTSDQELYPTCGKVCALSKPSHPNVSAHLGLSNSLMLPSLAEPGLGSCSRFKLASEFDVSGWIWRWCPHIRVHCEDALLLYLMKSVGSPSVISIKAVFSYSWYSHVPGCRSNCPNVYRHVKHTPCPTHWIYQWSQNYQPCGSQGGGGYSLKMYYILNIQLGMINIMNIFCVYFHLP